VQEVAAVVEMVSEPAGQLTQVGWSGWLVKVLGGHSEQVPLRLKRPAAHVHLAAPSAPTVVAPGSQAVQVVEPTFAAKVSWGQTAQAECGSGLK
jgi:hypothetical protein